MNLHELWEDIDADKASMFAARSSSRLLLVAVLGFASLWFIRRMIQRIDDPRIRSQLLFFVPKLIWLFAGIGAVAALGIDVSGMAAVMATVGFTGAVVFTPVGQNFVAGAMIRIDDVYRVGDIVTVNELHGRVVYTTLLRTELELPDGSTAWVPNSTFQDNEVLNHSRMGGWRIMVQVPLDRSTDRRRAQEIMQRVVSDLGWNVPGKRAFVVFDHVGGEATFFNAFAWISDRTQEPWYRGLLLDALVDALEAEGVSVGQTTNLSIGPTTRGPSVPDEFGDDRDAGGPWDGDWNEGWNDADTDGDIAGELVRVGFGGTGTDGGEAGASGRRSRTGSFADRLGRFRIGRRS
jgi:small-conductance mechanosensitive channel